MILNKHGVPVRLLMSAAVACASLLPSLGVRAQEPSSGTADREIRPVAEPGLAAVAVAPRITAISHTFTGTVQEEILLEISFSQSVTGFAFSDIQVAGGATPVPPLTGSGSSYSVAMNTSANYEGIVTVTIASNVAHNAGGEGNIGRGYVFRVDNKVPEIQRASVDRDVLTLTFTEDLDEDFVPSADDFSVSYIRDGRFGVADVRRIKVEETVVTLTLAEKIRFEDQRVEMFYDDNSATAIRDLGRQSRAGAASAGDNQPHHRERRRATRCTDGLVADADGTSVIVLEWDAPADTGGSKVTGTGSRCRTAQTVRGTLS